MGEREREAPSPRQLQCLGVIRRWWLEHGQAPSVREIADQLGLRSTNAVADLLAGLERKGWVRRAGARHASRPFVVVGESVPELMAEVERLRAIVTELQAKNGG